MGPTEIAIFLSWFAGAFVAGVSGLGAALVAVPILAFFLPMRENVLLSCLLLFSLVVVMVLQHRRHARPMSALRMLAGAVPGTLVGVWILDRVPAWALEAAIGATLVLFLAWQLAGRGARGSESWGLGAFVGGVSSMLGAAISTDGPPAAAYALYCGWPPRAYLGTLALFYVTRGAIGIATQAWYGLYTEQVLHYYYYGLPAVILGTVLALPVVKRISHERFRAVVLVLIALGAAACLGRAVTGVVGC